MRTKTSQETTPYSHQGKHPLVGPGGLSLFAGVWAEGRAQGLIPSPGEGSGSPLLTPLTTPQAERAGARGAVGLLSVSSAWGEAGRQGRLGGLRGHPGSGCPSNPRILKASDGVGAHGQLDSGPILTDLPAPPDSQARAPAQAPCSPNPSPNRPSRPEDLTCPSSPLQNSQEGQSQCPQRGN